MPAWLSAIITLIQTLPKIIEVIERLGAQMKQQAFQQWLSELDDVTRKLETAQSLQDRVDAARRLNDLVKRM